MSTKLTHSTAHSKNGSADFSGGRDSETQKESQTIIVQLSFLLSWKETSFIKPNMLIYTFLHIGDT